MTRPGAADLALIAFASLVLTSPAHAQPAEPPLDTDLRAAELFDLGIERRAAGDLDGACAAFAESQALDPAIGTALNLAACLERSGRVDDARALLRATIDEAERRGETTRATRARTDLLALEARHAAPAPVAESAPAADPTPAAARTSAILPRVALPATPARSPRVGLPVWLGVGAGALTAVGVGLVLSGHERQAAADEACPAIGQPSCAPLKAQSLNDAAVRRSRVGVGMLVGGAVVAEAALYLWWRGRDRESTPRPGLTVTSGGGMVTYEGSFR